MDKSFLDIYEDELSFLRDMGAEFADAHPKIAGRLKLDDSDVRDPYVERLLEGFAFLTARVRLRMQAQYPDFTQSLLTLLYPNFTAPIPSCTVLEFSPKYTEGALAGGFTLARGTTVAARIEAEDTPCDFVLAQDLTLHPLVVDEAEYSQAIADLEGWFGAAGASRPVEAAVRIRLRAAGDAALGALDLSALNLFVAGDNGRADRILMALLSEGARVVAQPVTPAGAPRARSVPLPALEHLGFGEDAALLPPSAKTFSGHRLLQEVFMMPEKFRFVGVHGLKAALAGHGGRAVDLVIGLERASPELADWISGDVLKLHCAPAVNLFQRRSDRISVVATKSEHMVTVDRTRPQDYEVHTVQSVEGINRRKGSEPARLPFHSVFRETDPSKGTAGHFNVRREVRLSSAQPAAAYAGTDIHLRMTEPGGGPLDLDVNQLVVTTLCTNRGLPLRLGSKTRYSLRSTAPVTRITALVGPTAPRLPLSQGSTGWDLVNALSLNHLSFTSGPQANASWLHRLMTLFIDPKNAVQRQYLGAYGGLSTDIINRRLPGGGPVSYGRGLRITLSADTERLRGTGPFVVASVLERFFRRAATLNAFTQTVLATPEGDTLATWPVRMGGRHVL